MKKSISVLLSALMILGSAPSVMADEIKLIATATPKEDKPAIIYIAEGFENQDTGKNANGFWWYRQTDSDGIKATVQEIHEVEKLERSGNVENQAIILKAENTVKAENFVPAYYAPIWQDFVLDFKFKLGSDKANGVIGTKNNIKNLIRGLYCDGFDSTSELINIGSEITVGNDVVKTDVDTDWHQMTLLFDMDKYTADVYFDGELIKKSVKMPEVYNFCEFTFASPDVLGEYWALDDVNIYVSEKVLSKEELEAQVKEYKESGLAPIDRYQAGLLYNYRNYIYDTMYNEFVMYKSGRRFYKDNQFHSMPHNVFEENGKLFVSLRAFCEGMGATVGYYDGVITVDYGKKTMKFSVDSKNYYINEEMRELPQMLEVRDWHTIVALDVLTDFFDLEYKELEFDVISFTGDVECRFGFQPEISASNRIALKSSLSLREEVIFRMKELLTYDLPTEEQILARFKEKNPDANEANILGTWYDFDTLRDMWKNGNDGAFKSILEGVLGVSDSRLKNSSLVPESDTFATYGQGLYDRGIYLSFAYKMTGDQKYLDGINQDIDNIYNSLDGWNADYIKKASHKSLTIGAAGTGVGTMYDWVRGDLDADRKAKLKKICDTVMEWFDEIYASPILSDGNSFANDANNQVIVIANGLLAPAIATFHENPEYSARLMAASIDNLKESFDCFAPAGEWKEGVSYWQYCVDTMPHVLMNIESAIGSTCGLYEAPGVSQTCSYPLSLQGTTGDAYPFGDADPSNPYNAYFMYEGRKNGDMATVNMRKENPGKLSVIDVFAWVPDDGSGASVIREADQHIQDSGTATMRTGWSKADTSVILHGGNTSDGHGHLDNGDVQFDMLGYRWAGAVGKECYNLYRYGDYNLKEGSPYTGYSQHDYYRNKGEGHNTVIANLGATRFDMEKNADSKYKKVEFSESESFAIVDMTQTNKIYKDASRGVKLDKISGEIVIQDEFKANEPTEFWWFMNTQAEIKLSDDKKSAILSTANGKKQIMISIVSDGDEIFQDLPSAPLPGYPTATEEWFKREDSGYSTTQMLRPPKESPLDGTFKGAGFAEGNFGMPFRKLAIQKKDSTEFNVTVVARPLMNKESNKIVNNVVIPLKDWKVDKNQKPARLNSLTVNGEALDEFKPDKFYYIVNTMTEKDPIPEIKATADEKYDIEVVNAEGLPGVTSVILRENGVVKGEYYFTFNPLNDTTLFVNERQIPIVGFTYNSQPEDNNPAVNLFDGNLTTGYTTDMAGGGVTLDFGKNVEIAEVMMSFRHGNKRTENLTIEASVDGENFELLFKGSNNGLTTDWQSFTFEKLVNARYIRVLFYGNSSGSSWCNITGMAAFSK